MEEPTMEQPFEGWNPGEPVPQVDPADMKALWEYGRSLDPREKAMGGSCLKHVCKPGADIWAVASRHAVLELLLDKKFVLLNLRFGLLNKYLG